MRVAVLQTNSRGDKAANVEAALVLLDRAAGAGADLAVLPENVDYMGRRDGIEAAREPIPGPTSQAFAAKARQHGMWVVGGSIHELSEEPGKSYNTSLLFDRRGEIVARYRKVHLYDVEIPGRVSARESTTVSAGCELVTAEIEGHLAGMSICYDLRFPELYRALAVRGAELLFVPAAFMLYTGKDHWEVLLRARAIENQCFVVAAGQVGSSEPNVTCYGRSMVVDPWGTVLATAPDGVGMAVADLDFDHLRRVRAELPSLANRRPDVYAAEPLAVTR